MTVQVWRSRVFLRSFAELPTEFALGDRVIRGHPLEEEPSGRLLSLIEMRLAADSISDAYYRTVDTAEDLADAVSFLSYAPASVEVISVTVPSSTVGVPFQIAVPVEGYRRSRAKLSAESLTRVSNETDEGTLIALRAFRTGLASSTPYRVIADLWTAIEALADRQARTDDTFVIDVCPRCGDERRTQPASQQYVRQYFEQVTPQDKTPSEYRSLADETRRLRAKLVHGGKLQDSALREESDLKITSLQSAVAAALVTKTGIRTASHRCQHLGTPCLWLSMIRSGPLAHNCQVTHPVEFGVTAQLSFLPDRYSEAQHFTIDIGVIMPIPIHPFGFPDPCGATLIQASPPDDAGGPASAPNSPMQPTGSAGG